MNPRRILYSENYSCNRTPEVLSALITIIAQLTGIGEDRIQIDQWHPSNSNFMDKMMDIRYIHNATMYSMRCDIEQFIEIYKQNARCDKLNLLLC